MVFLIVVGVLLVVCFVAILRSSRGFKGSGAHFADEERREPTVSKTWPRNDSGSGPF